MKAKPVEKEVPQTAVQKSTSSSSLKRVGTIYGSSLLKTLQSPKQIRQNKIVAAKLGNQEAATVNTQSKKSAVQGTSLLTGQKVPLSQAPTGPQLCLKFTKVTRPDGKPGLAAVIAASPTNQQGSSPQLQVAQQKTLQTSNNQQQRALPQTQQVQQMTPQTSRSKRIGKWSNSKAKRQPKTGTSQSVPLPSDETQQAVAGLIESENGTACDGIAQEARAWSFEKRRELNKEELAKTEKLLKVLRTLENRQKAQSEARLDQQSPQSQMEVSQQSQQARVQVNMQTQQTVATQQQTQTSVAGRQQRPIKQEFIQQEMPQQPVHQPNRPLPCQLPPDEDRLGLDQTAVNRQQKKLVLQQRKKKKIRRVSPEEATRYLESLSGPPFQRVCETAQEQEVGGEWSKMIKNIDVFMFPVYRCKLCPNYYSTVKSTIMKHMKEIHNWRNSGEVDYPTAPLEKGDNVPGSVEDKVKSIQKIFERKLRSQSTSDGSGGLGLQVELAPVRSSSEKTSASSITKQATREEESSDDDGGGDIGEFEEEEDDDGDDADDDVDDVEVDAVSVKPEGVSARKSPRFVRLSSTPMIRNYPHRESNCLSSDKEQSNNSATLKKTRSRSKAGEKLKVVLQKMKSPTKIALQSEKSEFLKGGQLESVGSETHKTKSDKDATKQSQSNVNETVRKTVKPKKQAKKVESSDEDIVDDRDLSEVKPKDSPAAFLKRKEPKKKLSMLEQKRRKREQYWKSGPLNYQKRLKEERLKAAKNGEGKANDDDAGGSEMAGNSEENLSPDKSEAGTDVPVRIHTTRSVSKSQGGLVSEKPEDPKDVTSTGKKRIRLSRYEAWKKIGLDPNSEPPWPCTVPDCNTYFTQLSSVLVHHCWTHDTFGDRQQRIMARSLGERYSLFEKREKRAVESASSSEDDEDEIEPSEAGTVKGKSKRRKKAPERFVVEFPCKVVGDNEESQLQDGTTKKKSRPVKCKFCNRYFANDFGVRHHMRAKHNEKWMKYNNLTLEDVAEINKKVKKEDATSANISLLANVADKLDDINLECRKCSFKARTEHSLKLHMDQTHPKYVKSMYSDSESEGDEPSRTEGGDGEKEDRHPERTSTRPVRSCRRKRLSDMLAKERKLNEVVPEILPDHAIYGQALEDEDEREVEDDGRDGPLLQCQECNFIAVSEDGFISHMKKLHDQDVVLKLQCEHCDFVGTRREVWDHKKKLHVETILCEMCGKACKGQKRLENHQKFSCGKKKERKSRRENNVTRTCEVCQRVFHSLNSYHYHMAGHKNVTYTCDICQQTFKRKTLLSGHHIRHHTEPKYSCDHCNFKSHYKNKLKNHMFEKHGIGAENYPLRKCTKVPGCSFSTKNPTEMSHHMEKHRKDEKGSNRYKYWCDTCSQSVKTLRCLARHQALHRDGDYKYKCNECGHQSTCSNTLRLHKINKHQKQEKIVICSLCGDSFYKPSELKNHHLIKHTQINPVKCKAAGCDHTFKYHYQMRKHFKEEHKELAQAEEIAKVELARQIINAPARGMKMKVLAAMPKKKRVYKKKPSKATGAKPGRKPLPLTPELIAHREELKRARNKRKYENRKAKMKRLGIKRKKYKKGGGSYVTRQTKKKVTATKSAEPDFDQEVVNAAQQLENIAQAFTSEPQPQQQASPRRPTQQSGAAPFPVKVVHMDETFGQPTALHHEYNRGGGEMQTTTSDSVYPPTTVISSEMQAIDELARTIARYSENQAGSSTSYTTQRIVQGSPTHVGDQPRPGEKPVSFLEVTKVHADGSRKVEMYPVFND